MSTGQVIQIVGTAVGAYFGGPYGALIGNYIGGSVGRSVDATHTNISAEGPRLSDLKIQTASYGAPIPRIYGRASISGNVIWSSDIIEQVTTSSSTQSAAKGGGGDSQTVNMTTYSYKAHLAIGLCEGPIIGIGKIWANGKLIYNLNAGADANSVLASQAHADRIRVYLGSETQVADPLIQTFEGAANVPAYRGLAYVVLEDFQLADFGNRIPQFEFEIIASATTQIPGQLGTIPSNALVHSVGYDNGIYSTGKMTLGGAAQTLRKKTYDFAGNVLNDQTFNAALTIGAAYPFYGDWHGAYAYQSGASMFIANVETGGVVSADWLGTDLRGFWRAVKGPQTQYAWLIYIINTTFQTKLARIPLNQIAEDSVAAPGSFPVNAPDVTIDLWTDHDDHPTLFFDGTWIWVANATSGILYRYTTDLVLSAQWTFASTGIPLGTIYVFGDRFAIGPNNAGINSRLFQLNGDGTTTLLAQDYDLGTGIDPTGNPYPATPGILVGFTKLFSVYPLITATTATLSAIVQAECLLSGLAAGDLDVSALTDNVRGYVVTQAPLSGCIQPLAQAFFFDPIESDGKLKFVKRNGASILTLAASDLAAHAPGEALPETIHHEHGMDLELPNEVALSFFDDDAAYQQGTQYARRLAVNSVGSQALDVPIVLSEAEALRIGQALLFDAWAARETFSFQTTRKFSKYEPGDIVTLPFPANDTTAVRVIKRDDGANGVIKWDAVFCEPSVYSQASNAAAGPTVDSTTSLPGPTLAEVMDIPLLRDVDDTFGFYLAALGYLDAWRGAQAYISRDGGGTYDAMEDGLLLTESSIGYAETVLGSPIDLEQFDEKCTVNVKLVEGSLSSVTRADVLNGLNIALLGDEIIQFRTATALSATEWTLSGLLRGRLGTDWAVASHAVNERFVLLDKTALRFVHQGSADVGVKHQVKVVTLGNRLAGTVDEPLTYDGVNMTPLAPVHVAGGRDPTGNLNIAWISRTRLDATWRDYVDAPLGEDTESYSIDILNGATVVRTISASTPSAQYTAAQQTTDFGAPQASIALNVYQISSRIGRGYGRAATL